MTFCTKVGGRCTPSAARVEYTEAICSGVTSYDPMLSEGVVPSLTPAGMPRR